ncbi:MAG TPA: 16S rRNA (adenine(1518)-N(6)/adenine(1519)-N(6))-dimethyltransferase RsmA [Trueperaceae bacterium]|nr:16S rRNA (adenine(1518)-N(6)/adenine(1519)-N(6))-dimethyltransferase RsmA [Trueperaceae bacterium]
MTPAGPPADPGGPPLTNRSVVRDLLTRHGLAADRSFGQNFLVEPAVLEAVVSAACVSADDTVLEVGPGLGTLTRALSRRAGRVVAVELDARLLPVLAETLVGCDNVQVVHADALRFDLGSLPDGAVMASNLPYNVATPVIARVLESTRFARLGCLVQLEVAERIVAAPGDPAYGALSLLVAHFARARIVRAVPPGAFVPPPKVTSAVVAMEVDRAARPRPDLFALVHSGFAHRRKTLKRNLVMAGYEAEAVDAALAGLGLDPRVRAERLGLAEFGALLEVLGPAPRRPGTRAHPD